MEVRPHRPRVGAADECSLARTRYVAQGGDIGASVTDAMGRQAPRGLICIHLSLLSGRWASPIKSPATSEPGARGAQGARDVQGERLRRLPPEQSTWPQTVGYSLLDSPAGLAAWLLDHDTDSYYNISRAFVEGKPAGQSHLDSTALLDNITSAEPLTGHRRLGRKVYWKLGQIWPSWRGRPAGSYCRSRFPSASRRSRARFGQRPAQLG